MKKIEKEIVHYLYNQQQYITSYELSRILNLSIRTIKTYISNLNHMYPNLIISSNRGYIINKGKASLLLSNRVEIPQDYDGRCIYLIKKLLLEKQNSLNIFDMCDDLFISFSTLKNDLSRMNTSFANFNITFYCKENNIFINGNEKNKRKLISHVMAEEMSDNFLDFMFLKRSFPEYDLLEITDIIKALFKKYNFYINDFSFINMLMHIIIMVNRIKQGNHINSNHRITISFEDKEMLLLSDLCNHIETFFHISLNGPEKNEIGILVSTSINFNFKNSNDHLKEIVPDNIIILAKQLIQKVDNQFLINLMSPSFITPFALHLKNLKTRLKNDTSIRNPMHDNIKNSCPTIYDIATFLSYQLMLEFKEKINKDEIAFLALHIGTEIERQKKNASIISCVLLCPEYLGIVDILYNKILMDFGEKINIIKIISFESELIQDFDLLITTIPLPSTNDYLTITLPPLSINYNYSQINEAINKIETLKKGELFANNIDRYFSDELFYITDEKLLTKNDVIHTLSNKMITLEYVEDNFEEEVLKRESASSTAFMKVAIPHPMKMSAYKTSVAILISKNGIEWDPGHIVHITFMIAFNKIDNHHFHELYESLILLLNENNIINSIIKCKNLIEFKEIIVNTFIESS